MNREQERREELDKWARSEGVPPLPNNLQVLSPEQIEKLFHLYLEVSKDPRGKSIGPIAYADGDRKKLEAIKWAITHGKIDDFNGEKVQRKFGWKKRFIRWVAVEKENKKAPVNTQLSMRGKRR